MRDPPLGGASAFRARRRRGLRHGRAYRTRHHGSIKRMESLFGISYPTVKNRLNAIASQLDRSFDGPSPNSPILDELERGEISVEEALERLS